MKAFLSLLFAAGIWALVAGCNLAPAYHPPTAVTPIAFKETNGWALARPSDGVLKGRWWEMFSDTNLNYLEEQVAVSNQTVAAALQNFFAARDIVKQARAAYYPTVAVAPSVTKSHSVLSGGGGSSATNIVSGNGGGDYTLFTLPADASWEPDLWGSVRNTVRANAYNAQASAALLENLKLTAQAEVAEYYYDLRGQDELIVVYTNTVAAYQQSVDLTQTLFQTGIDSELDVAQADVLLEQTRAQASALLILRAQYEHAIALLVGQPASLFVIPYVPFTNHAPYVPVGLPSTLLQRRPDIASAERTVASANASIGVTRAAFFPTLSLSASAGYEATSVSSLLSPPAFFWSVGATLSETVFDAGRRKAANDQAWATYRAQVANYRETVLTAFQQVEDNLAALRVLTTEVQQQATAVKASQRAVDISIERYRLGVTSYLNVILAQESLLSNQQTAVQLQTQQMVDSVGLILALGGSWDTSYLPGPTKLKLPPPPTAD